METRFTVLLIEVGVAVTIQAIVLLGILLAVRKSVAKMEAISDDLHRRTVPILESANSLLTNTKPQIEAAIVNLSDSSAMLRTQVEEIVDRARLQVVRVDELVTRTMDKVETTTEIVQDSVISPVRQIAGVLQGVSMGFNVLFGRRGNNGRRRQHESGVPGEEMFI